jgi:hypothetical protein
VASKSPNGLPNEDPTRGVVLSFWGIDFFRKLAGDFPDAHSIAVDNRVLLFTFGISIFTALLFGLAPAIQASNPDLNLDLKAGGWTTDAGARGLTRRLPGYFRSGFGHGAPSWRS